MARQTEIRHQTKKTVNASPTACCGLLEDAVYWAHLGGARRRFGRTAHRAVQHDAAAAGTPRPTPSCSRSSTGCC